MVGIQAVPFPLRRGLAPEFLFHIPDQWQQPNIKRAIGLSACPRKAEEAFAASCNTGLSSRSVEPCLRHVVRGVSP
jgi:hypothetical protein